MNPRRLPGRAAGPEQGRQLAHPRLSRGGFPHPRDAGRRDRRTVPRRVDRVVYHHRLVPYCTTPTTEANGPNTAAAPSILTAIVNSIGSMARDGGTSSA